MVKRIMIEETSAWQKPIIAIANSGTATKGFRYIVGSSPTGNFATFTAGQIVWYNGTVWLADSPITGWVVYDTNQSKYLQFNGSTWIDHGATVDISGKADKVDGAVTGNFAGLDVDGNLTDSGSNASDFESAGAVGTHESTYNHTNFETAYNARGQYDSDLGCILMDL